MDLVKLTEGARLLRAYLIRIGQTVPDFCDEHGISRQIVQRALHGAQQSFTVDFAFAVAKATGGEVRPESWQQETQRVANPDEIGRLFPRHRKPSVREGIGHTTSDFVGPRDSSVGAGV